MLHLYLLSSTLGLILLEVIGNERIKIAHNQSLIYFISPDKHRHLRRGTLILPSICSLRTVLKYFCIYCPHSPLLPCLDNSLDIHSLFSTRFYWKNWWKQYSLSFCMFKTVCVLCKASITGYTVLGSCFLFTGYLKYSIPLSWGKVWW